MNCPGFSEDPILFPEGFADSRSLAIDAIEHAKTEAEAIGCVVEGDNDKDCTKVLKEINNAENEMNEAQKKLDHTKKDGTPDPKYDEAIDHYKKALKHAQKALK